MGLRIVREPCKCCQTGRPCCEFGIHAPLPFTPDPGWTIESIDVSNNGQNQCVGRAVADIVLSKPPDPALTCASGTCAGVSKCGFGTPAKNQLAAILKSKLEGIGYSTVPVGNMFYTPYSFPSGYSYPPELEGCAKGSLRVDTNLETGCPSGCVFPKHSDPIWKNLGIGPLGCVGDARTWFKNNHYIPDMNALNTAWLANPIKFTVTVGSYTCEYWVFGVEKTNLFGACWEQVWTGTCWNTTKLWSGTAAWTGVLYGVRCGADPCTMGDYDWPMELPCACTGEYEKQGVSQSPECRLYLDSTRREYANGLCRFIARYAGAIESGQIECLPGSTLPDCVCCEEGQA